MPTRWRQMISAAMRLLGSAVLAGALSGLVYLGLPDELDVRTDIVGYPTFANFNIDRYFWNYALVVGLFPLVALGVFVALTGLLDDSHRPRGPVPRPVSAVEPVPVIVGRRVALVAAGRTVFVGAVLGFEAAVIVEAGPGFRFPLAVAAGYGAFVGLGAWLGSRAALGRPRDIASSLNILAAPITVAALYGVSEAAEVTVRATVVREYAWLPAWLAFGVAAGLLAWLARGLRRSGTAGERSALERRALLLVVAPVGLYVSTATLPGALGAVDVFEDGQVLAASDLSSDGAFPWRDLLVAHGLLYDVGKGLLGFSVFDESRWGFVAGDRMLVTPLVVVALYYLCVYLVGANWFFLLGTQLLVVSGLVFVDHDRFLLLPFVLLLLAALLRRASPVRAAAFTWLLAVQLIVTPESFVAGVALGAAVIVFELYYYERGVGLSAGFRRTWLCAAALAVFAVAWSVFLAAFGAFDDFVYSYRTFVPGHRYVGGIPVPEFNGEAAAPVMAVLAAFLFLVAWTRLHRPLSFQDWVALALAALTLAYYTKFLSRADTHVLHSFAVAVPLLFFAVYRAVTLVEAALVRLARARGVEWLPERHTVTLPLLVAILVLWPSTYEHLRGVPVAFEAVAGEEPQVKRLGYALRGTNDTRRFDDVGRALDSLLEPDDAVFDFSNAPGLFHYFVDRPAANRYYHVSLASRQQTQSDLVEQLERVRPRVVVFTSDADDGLLPGWDGISNQVRHYDVSRYLLDRYAPVANAHGYVLMRRADEARETRPELYFRAPPCDWGYAPAFFAPEADPASGSLPLTVRPLDPLVRLRGWAIDRAAGAPFAEIVVTRAGRVIGGTDRRLLRADVSDHLGDERFRRSGFDVVVPAAPDTTSAAAGLAQVRVYAVSSSGTATELPIPRVSSTPSDAEPPSQLDLPDRRTIRVLPPAPETGTVDVATVEYLSALTLPAGAMVDAFRWLELWSDAPLAEGRFALVDRLHAEMLSPRAISFSALGRGETSIRVYVGACSQWRGYASGVLFLKSTVPQGVSGVRLVRR